MKRRLFQRYFVAFAALAGAATAVVALGGHWGFSAVLAAAGAGWLAWRFASPLEEIRLGAERLGRGDLKLKVGAEGAPELAELADALNRMARQLDARIADITRERNEREAILESMQEGVLAIDSADRILTVNRPAERLLGASLMNARGRLVQEVVRNADLQRYLAGIHRSGHTEPEEGVEIRSQGGTVLSAKSAPLRDEAGGNIGVVVVLANITRLRQLEGMRREFVANVSHELRTPITSIKGFAETLLDGALDEPEEGRRFVEVIARQSERLSEIIEDLLALSRLERTEELQREELALADLLDAAVEAAAGADPARRARVAILCPAGLRLSGNPRLLEQALANLVDNALKYSPSDAPVRVEAAEARGGVEIRIADQGPGIPAEHLPRIFERFYRVDKARTREVGGTGLGLSIVKNVVAAHGGEVVVQSAAGKGSEFSVRLPKQADR